MELPLTNLKLKKELIDDKSKGVVKLFFYFLPLMEKGWKEEDIFKLLKFMESNPTRVKGRFLEDVVKLYNKETKDGKL